MLDTLLESKSHRSRSKGTALASAAFHTVLILGAAYATASGASAHTALEPPARVHWVTSPRSVEPAHHQAHRAPTSSATNRFPPAPSLHVPLDIPVDLPPIDLRGPSVDSSDFPSSTHSPGNGPAIPGNRVGGDSGVRAYDVSQVDTPVSTIGTFRPDYPAQLRAAGIEGQVVVQFVVNDLGRVDRESVRIVSASNDVFAASVTSAFARMRFTPARIGTRAVPQLVQQLFAFRLDR